MIPRIIATDNAIELIEKLKKLHGPLMFHQSGGCCDGSQPMCFNDGEFKVGGSDIWISTINDCKFYMAKDQFEYSKYAQLILDVTPGRGSSFSLEIPLGVRFFVKSKLFTDEELEHLSPLLIIPD
mgnify:CR=1 FL=1